MTGTPASVAFRLTRAGALEPNPTLVRQRAASAMSNVPNGTTFVTRRELDGGLGHYVVFPGTHGSALDVAKVVAAHAEQVDAPDLSNVKSVALLSHDRGTVAGSNPSVAADISAVVDAAASRLRGGEWVAFSVRRPTRLEPRRNQAWLEHRGVRSHHSLEASAVVVSLWAGADSTRTARGILSAVAGSLPGFDLRTVSGTLSRAGMVTGMTAAAAAGAGFTFLPVDGSAWGWGAFGLSLAGAAGVALGVIPTAASTLAQNLRAGLVNVPAKRPGAPAKPRRESTNREGQVTPARDGDYPLHPTAFLMSAANPVSLVAPHAGVDSGVSSTASRGVPPALRHPNGMYLGTASGEPVYRDQSDAWQGMIVFGEPGSGKSALLQAAWGFDAASKQGLVASHASHHAMVAFDTKDGASADEYQAWSSTYGDRAIRFDFSDEESPLGIDIFPRGGSATSRARRITNALKYTFGENSIGNESFVTLNRVLVGAFAVTPAIATEAGATPDKSAMYYAGVLLGTRGDDAGVRLATALRTAAERDSNTDAAAAIDMLGPLYDPTVTRAQRAQLQKAPQNKMEQMLAAEHWWSRPRQATWASLLSKGVGVIVNMGQANGYFADEEQREQISSLMMYTLMEAIQETCLGWFEQGKQVSIYSDELKHLAGTSPAVISWIRNDARSYGVVANFATQFPDQLDSQVRTTVLGLGTFVAFAQKSMSVAQEMVGALSVDGSEWATSDLFSLPRYTAVVRTVSGGQSLSGFTVAIPNFRQMRGQAFLDAQHSSPSALPRDEGDAGITFATVT